MCSKKNYCNQSTLCSDSESEMFNNYELPVKKLNSIFFKFGN